MTKLSKINSPQAIISKISLSQLNERLLQDQKKGFIRGEHWYRKAQSWYQVVFAYTNPYNRGTPNSELSLLQLSRNKLAALLQEVTLIFYGLGVGETEAEIVDWSLDFANYAEVVGVDVNPEFLKRFQSGLKNRAVDQEHSQILFRGYHALFEQITKANLKFENSKYKRQAHICLGNTIGNFNDQNEMFRLFSTVISKGDLLILGFQLDTRLDDLFKKYAQTTEFTPLALGWQEKVDSAVLKWKLDRENSVIKAFYQNLEVFRSKKYKIKPLQQFVELFGFCHLLTIKDAKDNTCIQVYQRKS